MPQGIKSFILLCTFFLYALLLPYSAQGQSEGKSAANNDSERLPEYRVGVKVDLVALHASVVDKNNHFIPEIEQSSFRVVEDGVEQKIELFSSEDIPVSMGVVLDLSGSMRGKIEQVKRSALTFVKAGNPDDEFFLIGFNDDVELLQDFTGDIDEISDALDNIVVAGETHLYDAVYLGVEKAQTGARSKKALVVITDGNDKTSYYSLKDIVTKLRGADVQVFCIGLLDDIPQKGIFSRWSNSEVKKYHDALVTISEETGGNAYFPEDAAEIRGIVETVARDIRAQYSIGYISSNTARDGAFRNIKIELTGKKNSDVAIRHRSGYFAPTK